jgi:hypothetical protein
VQQVGRKWSLCYRWNVGFDANARGLDLKHGPMQWLIEVVRASKILQLGFDETKLDGVSTINQWMLLQKGDEPPEVVTIEAAGLTVGGTAKQIAEHIRKSWDLGQQAVRMVREQLGPDLADELVPLVGGGVLIHKIQSSMHDTVTTTTLDSILTLTLILNSKPETLNP